MRSTKTLVDLNKTVLEEAEEYIQLLKKQKELERRIKDSSLDDKTKCEAYAELFPLLNRFNIFGRRHEAHLRDLAHKLGAKSSLDGSDNADPDIDINNKESRVPLKPRY